MNELEEALGFTAAQLELNRRGLLEADQAPPLFWYLVGLGLLAVVWAVVVRWTYGRRRDREQLVAGSIVALLLVLPALPLISGLANALLDRWEGRACEYTSVAGGVRESAWGMGILYFDVGQRAFRAPDADARAFGVVSRGAPYRAYYACHSETLASAEPAGSGWEIAPSEQYQQQLGELLGFTPSWHRTPPDRFCHEPSAEDPGRSLRRWPVVGIDCVLAE